MSIHYRSDDVLVWHGDCIDLMRKLDEGSMDAVVTDPPYALEFMGKVWDRFDKGDAPGSFQHWCQLWAAEALRVLKPGGHLLAFGGTRTWHRLTAGIEDAGFEIRDSIAWMYGSGFPKSLDVSKAIDKAAGAEREVVGHQPIGRATGHMRHGGENARPWQEAALAEGHGGTITGAPATEDAVRWQGWGTALKPAFEPVVVARKPLAGTVAGNVLQYGTGALNIDASRIGYQSKADMDQARVPQPIQHNDARGVYQAGTGVGRNGDVFDPSRGRWPSNVVLDAAMSAALDAQSGTLTSGANPTRRGADGERAAYGTFAGQADANPQRGTDTGGASRFFKVIAPEPPFLYQAKAGKKERPNVEGSDLHPTVKPLALMRWLIKLVTPPGGTVLDPFGGSGTTAEAALLEGFRCMVMEREAGYLPLIVHRIERVER